jgi:hypothetical protein
METQPRLDLVVTGGANSWWRTSSHGINSTVPATISFESLFDLFGLSRFDILILARSVVVRALARIYEGSNNHSDGQILSNCKVADVR